MRLSFVRSDSRRPSRVASTRYALIPACFALLAACGSGGTGESPPQDGDAGAPATPISCGPGTFLAGDECVPSTPRGSSDAGEDSDVPVAPEGGEDAGEASLPFDGGDAGPTSSFGVDPAHDNGDPSAAIASPLVPAWTAQFTGPVSFPVIVGDRAIVAANEAQPNVRALDLSSGTLLWGPIAIGSSVLLAAEGTTVFTLDGAGTLAALDSASGHQLWATQLQGQSDFESPPVAAGGLVYVNGLESGGTTYAVNAQTGALLWTADTFDGSEGTVAVSDGVVYEAEACDQVSAFDALTGDRKWFYSTSCTGGGGAAPAVYQGHVWVRDWALGNVILDTAGHVTGSFEASVLPSFGDGMAFYLGSSSSGATSGTLTAVDVASSTVKWSFVGDGQLCTSAVVAGGGNQVFVGSQSGNVYELDEATGAQKSVSDAGGPVSCGTETQAMGLGGAILLVPAGNSLVAFGGTTAAPDAGQTMTGFDVR